MLLSSHQKRQILGRSPLTAVPQGLRRGLRGAVLCAACLAGLVGCGQKGPLYLPSDPALPASAASPNGPVNVAPSNDKNDDQNNDLTYNPAVTR